MKFFLAIRKTKLFFCYLFIQISLRAIDPSVSNVHSVQQHGTRLVDITYDVVDPDSSTIRVYLKVSPDGGKTWKGPVESVSGDVGLHIVPGSGKRLVWNAGQEMPNQFGTKFRYRVGASDEWLPPDGMALIPAGAFRMGDDRVTGPEHTVMVSAFAMDKWEVSIELWGKVRNWGNTHGYELSAGQSYGANHPVHSVNFREVVIWNNARSEMEGKTPAYYDDSSITVVSRKSGPDPVGVKWNSGYRLPTEAEWEKAARGGVAGKLYPWGTDEINSTLANYSNSKGQTMPIGSYGANGYGLYDMAGNVFERCWDFNAVYPAVTQTDPRGPNSGGFRVIRGGCWNYESVNCQLVYRSLYYPGFREYDRNYGFRSVLPAGQP